MSTCNRLDLQALGSQWFCDFANEEPQTLKRFYGALFELNSV